MERLGERLRAARTRAGVTQAEASVAAGVTKSTISNWEAGRNMPCLIQFRSLMALYGTAADQILFGAIPVAMTRSESLELSQAARAFTPQLRAKVDVLLSLLAGAGVAD